MYINRNKVLADIRRAASRSSLGETSAPSLHWLEVVGYILDADAEDVAPVRKGKWVPKEVMIRSIDALNYICSECESEGKCTPYCQCCGASMLEE